MITSNKSIYYVSPSTVQHFMSHGHCGPWAHAEMCAIVSAMCAYFGSLCLNQIRPSTYPLRQKPGRTVLLCQSIQMVLIWNPILSLVPFKILPSRFSTISSHVFISYMLYAYSGGSEFSVNHVSPADLHELNLSLILVLIPGNPRPQYLSGRKPELG